MKSGCLIFILLFGGTLQTNFVFKHHDNKELLNVLRSVNKRCPEITIMYTLTESSVRGVALHALEFSTKPGHHEILKPEFKYVGNIHGNEVLGREMILKLADYFCDMYLRGDREVTTLIRSTRIHLIPCVNPDGWQVATDLGGDQELGGRRNNNSVDLNRNFPNLNRIMYSNEMYHVENNNHLLSQVDTLSQPLQPETKALIRLIIQIPFVLSATMHGGDLVANYPYDASRTGKKAGEYAKSPDDDTFKQLALVYAKSHAEMSNHNRKECVIGKVNFGKQDGITNGADWYSVNGGLQDFNYLSSNAFELTLELGCIKYTHEKDLEKEWKRNKNALINFIWQTHIGIKGIVYNRITKQGIPNTIIHITNITENVERHINHDITSVHDGDYYRLLTPGKYRITAYNEGFLTRSKMVHVENHPFQSSAQRVDFALIPKMANNIVDYQGNGDYYRDDNIGY